MKRKKFGQLSLTLAIILLLTYSNPSNAEDFWYYVNIGEKYSYQVSILVDGDKPGVIDYSNSGFNLTEGEEFEMEVVGISSNCSTFRLAGHESREYISCPNSDWGSEIEVRFVTENHTGEVFSGFLWVFQTDSDDIFAYWESQDRDQSINILGETWDLKLLPHTEEEGSPIWTGELKLATDEDNFIKIVFNLGTGILTSFEQKTTKEPSYTHVKFERVDTSFDIPGWEYPIFTSGMILLGISSLIIRKQD